MSKKIISFASDFGLEDGSVGIVKGVINRIDPDIKINDISHGIPPQNIKQGSLLLMRAIQYIPQGVLLGVVDPGVGTERKPIALETDWGVMIGPDNGLLNLACATVGGAQRGFLLENENWIIPSEGNTFHARDVFSPFAAESTNLRMAFIIVVEPTNPSVIIDKVFGNSSLLLIFIMFSLLLLSSILSTFPTLFSSKLPSKAFKTFLFSLTL